MRKTKIIWAALMWMLGLVVCSVQADDGKAFRLCGYEDGKILLREYRKPVVRPVVALPVEEPHLAMVSYRVGEKLDAFDLEALDNLRNTVRVDGGADGVAREVFVDGLAFKDFLARERSFRPPVAPNGFSSWDDAERFASFVATNGANRTYASILDVLRELVDEEMVRPVVESADGKKPAFRAFVEGGITNRVLKNLTNKAKVDVGAIDLDQLKFGVMLHVGGFGKAESDLIKLMQIYSRVKIKAELNGDVCRELEALQQEMDARPGTEFVQLFAAEALAKAHHRSPSDNTFHPTDATNYSRRVAALAARYADSPERTRAVFEQSRTLISRLADADTTTYGYALNDRRHLVACVRASKADPWLADVLEGFLELDMAWYGKGDMYSYCSKPSWKDRVYPHLIAAREAFHRAWKRHPQLPEGAFGMLAVEWELYHSDNAARWLGWLWAAEIDTPWMYRPIRHRLLQWFDEEPKAFDIAYKGIADFTKRDRGVPYRAAQKAPVQRETVFDLSLTNEWRVASFVADAADLGLKPYRDAGKLLDMQYDPERRASVWPIWWRRHRLPLNHEGEIDVEVVEPLSVTNRVALGLCVDGTTLYVFSQVGLYPDGKWGVISYHCCFGSDSRCYQYATGEKAYPCAAPPTSNRFRLRYRIKDRLLCSWIDGNLTQKLWCVNGISRDVRFYEPAILGTGVKVHSVRYRQIPANAGLEEYVP